MNTASTAQAILSRSENGWLTRVAASVYHEAGSFILLVQCEAQRPASGEFMQQSGIARYQSFKHALDILDTGIFNLTTTTNFTLDMYNVKDDTQPSAAASSADNVYDQDNLFHDYNGQS